MRLEKKKHVHIEFIVTSHNSVAFVNLDNKHMQLLMY